MDLDTILFLLVITAGFYMAWNIGANDVANAMGTSVGSGALTLRRAVIIAAILEFSGAFFFGSHVSHTIQSGIVNPEIFSDKPMILMYGMLASLIAAGGWLQIASYYGWPVSTTHAIVGSIVGFGALVGGIDAIYWKDFSYIALSWIISPLLGGIISFGIFSLLRRKILYTSNPIESTKKLAPFLVFTVVTILSLVLFYKGLKNISVNFSFSSAIFLSACFGILSFLVTKLGMYRIKIPDLGKISSFPGLDVSIGLQKARKHLQRVQTATTGELKQNISRVLEEVENLTHSVNDKMPMEEESSEFAGVEKIFGYLQIMTACLMAFAHGANDVANAIGPLSASLSILLTKSISSTTVVSNWALGLGGVGIVIGLATWGWRVIETIGKKITELTPTRGFAAEFGAAMTIVFATRLGLPISTTHTLVGSVIGVGLARGLGALDLNTTRDIFLSWIVTIPAGALLTICVFYLLQFIFPY